MFAGSTDASLRSTLTGMPLQANIDTAIVLDTTTADGQGQLATAGDTQLGEAATQDNEAPDLGAESSLDWANRLGGMILWAK